MNQNNDLISRQEAIDAIVNTPSEVQNKNIPLVNQYDGAAFRQIEILGIIEALPSAQPEIIRCKDCKHWIRQTNYRGAPLSFGFCESEDMWASLYGETTEVEYIDTDDNHYCGYAERRTDER